LAQTLRNAAQRHLTGDLGALGATLVRFLYGLPFAALWLGVVWVAAAGAGPLPPVTMPFLWWTLVASLSQIAATALLLRCMQERNFALGVAYAKTELLQIAILGLVLLGDRITMFSVAAILVATAGVVLVSLPKDDRSLKAIAGGWASRAALLGIGSGTAFGLAAVGYRGAALALDTPSIVLAAAYSLVWAQALQTVLLGGWLLWRQRRVVVAVLLAWRVSMLAGAMGAIGSACWFTAMALEPVANVRTLGLIELFFSYLVSRRFFRERLTVAELLGFVLLALGLVGIVGQF
jgi:drug/metabolite transporter (DMT)-like permease